VDYHCIRRARSRYGLDMTVAEIEGLEYAIQHELPIAVPIWSNLDGQADLFAVRYQGQWLSALTKHGKIATFLPRNTLAIRKPFLRRWKREKFKGDWAVT
jgi:hypothetical protein